MKKKTIGIIGPGKHFEKNIFPILKLSRFFLIKAILRNKNKSFFNLKTLKEKNFFKEKYDFIYISTPNKLHEKYIIKSLEIGSHVICEKPFLTNQKNLKKIISLAKNKKKLIFEAFMFLYHPVYKFVKNLNKKNLKYIIANFRFPSLSIKNNRYYKNQGDGFLFDAACYLIALDNDLFYNFKIKKNIFFQKIKKKVNLMGNFTINSEKINRFYFWGEGQNYNNNIELFFKDKVIYINKFFSKFNNEKININIFHNKKIKITKIKPFNQFKNMFLEIEKKYMKGQFQLKHRNMIVNQIKILSRINL